MPKLPHAAFSESIALRALKGTNAQKNLCLALCDEVPSTFFA
jgi:hypothetical protein